MRADRTEPAAGRSTAAFYTLLSVMFINMLGFGVVVPLLPFFAQSFHAKGWQIALIFSAYSMGSFFGEPFWGRLSDRIGRKPLLISTLIGNCLCYGLLAFAPNVWFAFFIRLFGGMAAGNGSVVQGYIADVTEPDDRAQYMARLGASYNIGFIVGPFIGGILASPGAGSIGFKIPLLVASSFGGLAALGVALFVRESRQRRPAIVRAARSWEMVGYAARHPVIGQLILLTFVVGVAFTGIESTFGLWAQHRFGWQPRDVGMVFGVTGAVSALSQFFVTGPLSRRYGEARMLAVGMAGTAICIGLQPLSDGHLLTYGLMAMMAMFQSVAFPNSGALMSRSIDEHNQGQIMGLNNASGAIARVAGPAAALQLFDGLNINAPFFMGALIVAPAIFLALSAGRAALAEQREVRAAA